MEALKADIKSQKIGNPVTSRVSDAIARKGGALKAKHTKFDKAYKENERIANIVKAAQEKSNAEPVHTRSKKQMSLKTCSALCNMN